MASAKIAAASSFFMLLKVKVTSACLILFKKGMKPIKHIHLFFKWKSWQHWGTLALQFQIFVQTLLDVNSTCGVFTEEVETDSRPQRVHQSLWKSFCSSMTTWSDTPVWILVHLWCRTSHSQVSCSSAVIEMKDFWLLSVSQAKNTLHTSNSNTD